MSKTGVNRAEVPYHVQVWECPLTSQKTINYYGTFYRQNNLENDKLFLWYAAEFELTKNVNVFRNVQTHGFSGDM